MDSSELAVGESLRTASFRAYAFGGAGSSSEFSTSVLAGRLEACPLAVNAGDPGPDIASP